MSQERCLTFNAVAALVQDSTNKNDELADSTGLSTHGVLPGWGMRATQILSSGSTSAPVHHLNI
jgi:hypothetical protein